MYVYKKYHAWTLTGVLQFRFHPDSEKAFLHNEHLQNSSEKSKFVYYFIYGIIKFSFWVSFRSLTLDTIYYVPRSVISQDIFKKIYRNVIISYSYIYCTAHAPASSKNVVSYVSIWLLFETFKLVTGWPAMETSTASMEIFQMKLDVSYTIWYWICGFLKWYIADFLVQQHLCHIFAIV